MKTQNYHWNVECPHFKILHDLFEEQYKELATAIDELAELIRSLGEKTPVTFKVYEAITHIKNGNEHADAATMVRDLAQDQDVIQKPYAEH